MDTGEVSERVFVKSHLSELVISSQNPIFNSKAEIQNPRRFHPSKPEPPLSQGIPCACMGRTKGMGGNAKEIQIIFHNPECIQNKIFQGGLNYRSTWQSKGRKRQKKAALKLCYSVSLHGTYTDLHFISGFYEHLLDAVGKKMFLFSLKSRELCKSASAVDITQINQSKRTQGRREKETCAAQCLDRSLTPRTAAPNM